jgi:hypothetical protein
MTQAPFVQAFRVCRTGEAVPRALPPSRRAMGEQTFDLSAIARVTTIEQRDSGSNNEGLVDQTGVEPVTS